MINDILIFDDLLPAQYQDAIEDLMLGELSIPWFLLNDITYEADNNKKAGVEKKTPALCHTFNNENGIYSDKLDFIKPIAYTACSKINFSLRNILRTRSFLQLPTNMPSKINNPHVDMERPHLVCLYYVNDTTGPTVIYEQTLLDTAIANVGVTEFKILQTVEPKKGRFVLFNGHHYHSSSTPVDVKRCIINFDLE